MINGAKYMDPLLKKRTIRANAPYLVSSKEQIKKGDIVFLCGEIDRDKSLIREGSMPLIFWKSISSIQKYQNKATEAARNIKDGVAMKAGVGCVDYNNPSLYI